LWVLRATAVRAHSRGAQAVNDDGAGHQQSDAADPSTTSRPSSPARWRKNAWYRAAAGHRGKAGTCLESVSNSASGSG